MPIHHNSFSDHGSCLSLIKWSIILLGPIAAFFLLSPNNNTAAFIWLNSHLATWLGAHFWGLVTCMGDGFFLFPLGMLLVRQNPIKQQALVVSIILAALALNIGKHAFDATRPLGLLGHSMVTVVGPSLEHFSMPSGHTGTIAVLAGLALVFSNKPIITATVILSFFVGLSRIAVGAHWPIDVVVGAWFGLISCALGVMISAYLNLGFAIRLFYVFLGFIPAFLLPFYHNGFQEIQLVQYVQYGLALLSLILAASESRTLWQDYTSKHNKSA